MLADPVACTHFVEPEELLRAVPDVTLRATPAGPGRFSASLITIRLGEVVFQTGSCAPAVIMAQAAPGTSVVQLPFAGTETFILNGRPLTRGLVGLYGGGATLERVSQQTTGHAAFILPTAKAERLLALPSASPLLRPRGQALVQAHPEPWQRAVELAQAIARAVAADAEAFRKEETRRSMRASLIDAVREVVSGDEESGAPRQVRTSPARRRIVNVADDYLVANPSRSIYTEELCNVLDISPARLADAFRSSFGITPHRFLKLRRLAMVRATLRDREGHVPLVRSVAHAHGFWHLGQFARDYRAIYGETPSETLARTRGVPPRDTHYAGPTGDESGGDPWLRHT